MGYSVNYVAARLRVETMADSLGLIRQSASRHMPERQSWIAQSRMTGWTIFFTRKANYIAKNVKALHAMSIKGDVICCEVIDTVNYTSAEYLKDGQTLWRIQHSGSEDPDNLTVKGGTPSIFDDIKNHHIKAQSDDPDVDHIYEIPLGVARHYLNFRHDEEPADGLFESYWIVDLPKSKGLLSRFFG